LSQIHLSKFAKKCLARLRLRCFSQLDHFSGKRMPLAAQAGVRIVVEDSPNLFRSAVSQLPRVFTTVNATLQTRVRSRSGGIGGVYGFVA
jgi:hypothetical protein